MASEIASGVRHSLDAILVRQEWRRDCVKHIIETNEEKIKEKLQTIEEKKPHSLVVVVPLPSCGSRIACHMHFKKYSDPEHSRHFKPIGKTSNHERTRLLDRSSLTIIAAGQSRFYTDITCLLSKEGESVDRVEFFGKHMFEQRRSCHRPQRMHMYNQMLELQSQPTIKDDQDTQKALVENPSRMLPRRQVQAVPRRHVRSPQKERFNYKLSLIKLWNRLKSRQKITKR
uniref:CACTA en-spm transposon protein n=1 Tax=Cucumis melo TaxID=3656 RepID=A0A9I9E820_CUCME